MSPAEPEMKPSSTTTLLAAAVPSMTPASTPISNPPTFANISNPSVGSISFFSSACSMTLALCLRCSSDIPVPRPVTFKGDLPQTTLVMALADVVLPMPMSPVPTMSAPFAISFVAIAMPSSRQRRACSIDIAGPFAMLAVPLPIESEISSWLAGSAEATPASMMTTLAPTCRASTLIAAPPLRKLCTIWAVTSCGYALTPSAATPWSPAASTITLLLGLGTA